MIQSYPILEGCLQIKIRIFVKGFGFLSFAKNMGKNVGKNISKSLNSKYSQNFLIMLNNLQQMSLKFFQKESFKKQKQPVI